MMRENMSIPSGTRIREQLAGWRSTYGTDPQDVIETMRRLAVAITDDSEGEALWLAGFVRYLDDASETIAESEGE